MRHIKKYLLLTLLSTMLFGCDHDFGDINNDPNSITKVGADNLFHNVVGAVGSPFGSEFVCFMPMMQYVATTNGNYDVIGNTYTVDGTAMGIFSSTWRNYCVDYLRYLNFIDDILAQEEGAAVKKAQTDIMRALLSSQYTDTFGPIPYDEGGQALNGILYPVYRNEKEVYLGTDKFRGILQLLDDAVQTLKTSTDKPYENDIFYGGNKDKWMKLGSSLLLRNAIKMSNVEPELAKMYVKKAVEAGLITNFEDIAKVNHQVTITGQPGYLDNGIASNLLGRVKSRGYCFARSYISTFKEYSTQIDPRLKYIAGVYDSEGKYYDNVEDYEGMKNGCEMDDVKDVLAQMTFDQDFVAGIGVNGFASFNKKTILNRKSAYIVMGADEVNFLLAEAALKDYLPGKTAADADTYYRDGIRLAMKSLALMEATMTDVEIDNYINTLPALGSNTAMRLSGALDEVITQKWLCMFGNGMQIWNDWRRTHYPSIITNNPIVSSLGTTNGKVIGRLPFPQDEFVRNKENYEQGTGALSSKVNDYKNDLWWAKPYYK